MELQKKARDYLFDNYKVLLITLVVMGHFLDPNYQNNAFLYELKWAIVSVHMPAFIFVSGYFSKKKASFRKLVETIAIPYLVYEFVYFGLYYLMGKETTLSLLRPKFSLWYLMGLFVWKLLAPYIAKIPACIPLTMIAGLLIGIFDIDNLLSIPRILFFFPFFLAGMKLEHAQLERLQTKRWRLSAVAFLILATAFLICDQFHRKTTVYVFYGRYSYAAMEQTIMSGILMRILCYIISFLMIFSIMLLLPTKETKLSYIGQRTMPIYIFHGLLYSVLKFKTTILSGIDTGPEAALLLLFCSLLVLIFSTKPFVAVTDFVSQLPTKLARGNN